MRIVRETPGVKVGWQRRRAWIEVFSSEEITYSSSRSRTSSHRRAYRSRMRLALSTNGGSRANSHERYCQGLRASVARIRRTVEGDIGGG